MAAHNDSSSKDLEKLARWRIHEVKQEDTQPDKISAKRRSAYRSGSENDGVKGPCTGEKHNKG